MPTSSLPAAVSGSITFGNSSTVWDLAGTFIDIINGVLVPVIFAIAFLTFLWGVYQYFIAGGADEEKRKSGRDMVMFSVIGFAIMVSLWGLVNLVVNSLGLNSKNHPDFPCIFGNCGTGASGGVGIHIGT